MLEQENKELKLSVGNSRQAIDQLTQQSSGLMNLKSDLEKANDKIRVHIYIDLQYMIPFTIHCICLYAIMPVLSDDTYMYTALRKLMDTQLYA